MKRFGFVGLSLLFLQSHVHAQSVSTLMGARAAGMGYASSTLSDAAALFNNSAATAQIRKASAFYAMEVNPFLPGSGKIAAGFSFPKKFMSSGIGVFRFGDDHYSEQIISGCISNKFGITSLGLKVNYIQYQALGFGTSRAVSLTFGGLAQITPQIQVGAYIVNLNQSRISADERLPTKLTVGIGFHPTSEITIATELEKDIDYHATWRTGIEYSINKKVFVRSGFNLNPAAGYFGVGTQSSRLNIDYAIGFKNSVGTIHQASATYVLEKAASR